VKGTSTIGLTEVEPGRWTTVTHTIGDATATLIGGSMNPDVLKHAALTATRELKPLAHPGKYAEGVGLLRWIKDYFL
jgi:hypothetical protein